MKRTYEELEQHCHDLEDLLALSKVDELDIVRFVDVIAPKTVDLPPIMTMCKPAERKVLIAKFNKRHVDGVYTSRTIQGKNKGPGRYHMNLVTERSLQEQRAGLRKVTARKDYPNAKPCDAKVNIPVTHIALLAVDRFPTERRNYASHICHFGSCVNAAHLVWESQSDNMRRECLCNRKGGFEKECACGLFPPCNFMLHPQEQIE